MNKLILSAVAAALVFSASLPAMAASSTLHNTMRPAHARLSAAHVKGHAAVKPAVRHVSGKMQSKAALRRKVGALKIPNLAGQTKAH